MTRLLTNNPGLKLLALFIAMFLWILLAGGGEAVRIYPVRIDFLTSDDQLLAGETSGSVSVTLRGPEQLLHGLDASALALAVDLRELGEGESAVPLVPNRQIQGLPQGLVVEGVTPEILPVHLERKVRRPVRILPRLEGDLPAGCRFTGYEVDPPEATVEGAGSQVEALFTVSTEPIAVPDQCQDFTRVVSLMPAPGMRLVSTGPVKVDVTVRADDAEAAGRPEEPAGP